MAIDLNEDFADVLDVIIEDNGDDGTEDLDKKVEEEHTKYVEKQEQKQQEKKVKRVWSAPPLSSPHPASQRQRAIEIAELKEQAEELNERPRISFVPRGRYSQDPKLTYMHPPRPMSAGSELRRPSSASPALQNILEESPDLGSPSSSESGSELGSPDGVPSSKQVSVTEEAPPTTPTTPSEAPATPMDRAAAAAEEAAMSAIHRALSEPPSTPLANEPWVMGEPDASAVEEPQTPMERAAAAAESFAMSALQHVEVPPTPLASGPWIMGRPVDGDASSSEAPEAVGAGGGDAAQKDWDEDDLVPPHHYAVRLTDHDLHILPTQARAVAATIPKIRPWSARTSLAYHGILGMLIAEPTPSPTDRRSPSPNPGINALQPRGGGSPTSRGGAYAGPRRPMSAPAPKSGAAGSRVGGGRGRASATYPIGDAPMLAAEDSGYGGSNSKSRRTSAKPYGNGRTARRSVRPSSAHSAYGRTSSDNSSVTGKSGRPESAQGSNVGRNAQGPQPPIQTTFGEIPAICCTAAVPIEGQFVSVYLADTTRRVSDANRLLSQIGSRRRYRIVVRSGGSEVEVYDVTIGIDEPYGKLTLPQFLAAHTKLKLSASRRAISPDHVSQYGSAISYKPNQARGTAAAGAKNTGVKSQQIQAYTGSQRASAGEYEAKNGGDQLMFEQVKQRIAEMARICHSNAIEVHMLQ